jgi:hypothetical protein
LSRTDVGLGRVPHRVDAEQRASHERAFLDCEAVPVGVVARQRDLRPATLSEVGAGQARPLALAAQGRAELGDDRIHAGGRLTDGQSRQFPSHASAASYFVCQK